MSNDVALLESAFLTMEQVECPVSHHFGPGVYIREVVMPAGAYIIGHNHREPHFNVMLEGRLTLIREDGTREELTAPMTFVAEPGRKIAQIHETVRWQNIYATNETDVGRIEDQLFEKSAGFLGVQRLLPDYTAARKDFRLAIAEYGFTEQQVACISTDESDMVSLPFGEYKFTTGPSDIHGRGLFATGDYKPGEFIAAARIGGKRTIAGRFTNHSPTPNAEMFENDGDIYLLAKSVIYGCKGGMNGDEITVDYRQALGVH